MKNENLIAIINKKNSFIYLLNVNYRLPFENQKLLVICLINIRVKNIKNYTILEQCKSTNLKKFNTFLNNECCLTKESPCICIIYILTL